MTTLVLIFWVIIAIGLVVVTSVKPRRTPHTHFELERLNNTSVLKRERLLGGVIVLVNVKLTLLIILLTYTSVVMWSAWGMVVAAVTYLFSLMVGRLQFINRRTMKIYERYEPMLLDIVGAVAVLKWLGKNQLDPHRDQHLESTEHLLHLVESSGGVLSSEQQNLIRRGLRWHTMEVKKVMTAADEIVSVKKTELLGPLVLDDLHKSGHTRFPVVANGVDTVVGQINIANLFEIDGSKKTPTAAQVMMPLDIRLHHDTPLPEALRQLNDHPAQLGLVIDDQGKTVGLVTLSDVLNALLGKNRGGVV